MNKSINFYFEGKDSLDSIIKKFLKEKSNIKYEL